MSDFEIGDFVKEIKHGYEGVVSGIFDDWKDLKRNNDFLTIEPDDDKAIIDTDPKDEWLNLQSIPFTDNDLKVMWFSITCLDGGSIWTCENYLEKI